MTISAAKSNAMSARSASGTEQKLNYLAQAVYELAKVLGEIEDDVVRIRKATKG
jgi:hypothetical protein